MSNWIRLFLVILLASLSIMFAWPYFFLTAVSPLGSVLFGLLSAGFWFIASVVHIFLPSPRDVHVTNADLANATAAALAGCLVLINVNHDMLLTLLGKLH